MPVKNKRPSLWKMLATIFVVCSAILLLGSGLARYVDPAKLYPFYFLGLGYVYLVALNAVLFIACLMARSAKALIPFSCILFTWPSLSSTFAIHSKTEPDSASISLMSFNVRNFDLYDWNKDQQTRERILSLITESNAQILCLQEFYHADTGENQNISLLRKSGFPHYYFHPVSDKRGKHWGMAIFSSFPIVKKGHIDFAGSTSNAAVYVDTKTESGIIRVYNAHLQSVYLNEIDYGFLDAMNQDTEVQLQPLRTILSKMKHAAAQRSSQAIQLSDSLKKSEHPVILCGDFNDSPSSFTYCKLSAGLNDAFLEAGWGISPTYAAFPLLFRIDYILADSTFRFQKFKTIREPLTDHYPVVATFTARP